MFLNMGLKNLQQQVVRLRRRIEGGVESHLVDRALGRIQEDVETLERQSRRLESVTDYEITISDSCVIPGMFMPLPEWFGDMCVAAGSQDKKPTAGEKAAKRALTDEVNMIYRKMYGEGWITQTPGCLRVRRRRPSH